MNPPVSNAVQGAYFVAAVLTGIVFGAGSIVFTEVTEGLGCLLGGFSLSMWFLALKPGGLLRSTGQKAIFIAAFSVGIYALSFSRYTRPYGLIGSTSFAGATVMILGIDCFSRAGLKEFWLYIWGMYCCGRGCQPAIIRLINVELTSIAALNNNLFPLDTTTYPITRGVRVEIAGIFLIFLLGIISQSKLWKVIKERRERKAVERHDREQAREREEEDLGRQLEEGNYRERAQWEAVYGDKDKGNVHVADSGIGIESASLRKISAGSASFTEPKDPGSSRAETFEMNDLNASNRVSHAEKGTKRESGVRDSGTPTVMVGQDDDEINALGSDGQQMTPGINHSVSQASTGRSTPQGLLEVPNHRRSTAGKDNEGAKDQRSSMERSVPPTPEVVPLPFRIPIAEDSDDDDNASSNGTFAESEPREANYAKRMSGRSILKRLSGRSLLQHSESKEALVVPHMEDDQASSVAATVNDDGDEVRSETSSQSTKDSEAENLNPDATHQRISSQSLVLPSFTAISGVDSIGLSPTGDDHVKNKLSNNGDDVTTHQIPNNNLSSASSPDNPTLNSSGGITKLATQRTSLTSSTDPKGDEFKDHTHATEVRRGSKTPSEIQATGLAEMRPKSMKSMKSVAPSEASGRRSSRASFSDQLPAKLSKVVMSYRTNEWAKHLDRAEKPELDELKLAEQIAERNREAQDTEATAPVNVEELRQTASDAQPQPAPRSTSNSRHQSLNISRSASKTSLQDQQHAQQARPTLTQGVYGTIPQRSSSQTLVTNAGEKQSSSLTTRGLRSSSTPLNGLPLLEAPLEEGPESNYPSRHTPSPLPSNTLLAKRENLVRNRYSSLPFSQQASPAASSIQLTPNDSASIYNHRPSSRDDDHDDNDENMTLSQRRSLIQQQLQRRQSSTYLAPQGQLFDAHQPQRHSSTPTPDKREAMLASWRESVRQDLSMNQQPNSNVDARRQDLMMEKYQSALNQQQQAMAVNHRDSVFDQAMRRGDMLDLHKEALRKMQASANKHV